MVDMARGAAPVESDEGTALSARIQAESGHEARPWVTVCSGLHARLH